MQNFQDIVSICTQTYSESFKSALVYLTSDLREVCILFSYLRNTYIRL